MKKALSTIIAAVLIATALLSFTSCGKKDSEPSATATAEATGAAGTSDATVTPEPTATPEPTPEPVIEEDADAYAEVWNVCELTFESTAEIASKEKFILDFDITFTHRDTGTTLTIPSFWDGKTTYKVRFAPTLTGMWDYTSTCTKDASLNGLTGKIGAKAYSGDLAVYKNGFVKVDSTKKYFVYDNGTPFFYLGDTHWGMYTEEIDKGGANAGSTGAESHFKYIVDKRVQQGFTVYQSEPIGCSFDVTDGIVHQTDIKGFQKADQYYQYIAQAGLTHANAEFFFASSMTKKLMENESALEGLSRYWVARFGAYPVMWTLAQEIDNDFYYERGDQKIYDYSNNPWVTIAKYLHKYDAYQHPLSGHQENTYTTTVTGLGTGTTKSNNGQSAFYSKEVTEATGHNWWAAQYSPSIKSNNNYNVARDYYISTKVAINYESRYCYLWTKNFGARAQGWISLLMGFAGYGYGAIDIWLYKSSYDVNSTSNDGVENITPDDKAVKWSEAVEFESAYQVGYLRQFFEKFDWYNLRPMFETTTYFKPATDAIYCGASKENQTYVLYFYGTNTATGSLQGLDTGTYQAAWFNPRTNEFTSIGSFDATNRAWDIPQKPDGNDWVLIASKSALW